MAKKKHTCTWQQQKCHKLDQDHETFTIVRGILMG